MRVTGSKTTASLQNRLSIRLRQSGQSFSVAALNECHEPCEAVVELDTSLCAAYPADTALSVDEILRAEGIDTSLYGSTVCVALDKVAVGVAVALTREASDAIAQCCEPCGGNVVFRSPLLQAVEAAVGGGRGKHVALIVSEAAAYAAVAERGELLYCDAFECRNVEELIYITATLSADFDLRRADVVLSGARAYEAKSVLKRQFRHLKCE